MGQAHVGSLVGWICKENSDSSSQHYSQRSRSSLERTSHRSSLRLRCSERVSSGPNPKSSLPVKLIIFDFDETLTMVTFMTKDGTYRSDEKDWAAMINFESPWVEGSRVKKLHHMLESLVCGKDGQRRTLAILTKNSNKTGVRAVLNMLNAANLADHFSAIWTLPWRSDIRNGAYKDDQQKWMFFDPPADRSGLHKADVLQHIVNHPKDWFPYLSSRRGQDPAVQEHEECLLRLAPEQIVLVDDQRANFQSDSGACVVRYCKVARYDADYHDYGLVRNMGGIGAHDDADYETLRRFVEDPWMCKETLQIRCQERDFEGQDKHHPVELVVFDFDETLTLATFMPQIKECTTKIGWRPSENEEWNEADLVQYNFETPWVDGSRVKKLAMLLEDLTAGKSGHAKVVAVLTQNDSGAVAVLNLLEMAGLAHHFAAIWAMSGAGPDDGVFQKNGTWTSFKTPRDDLPVLHKADVLQHVASNPSEWFPQLLCTQDASPGLSKLQNLRPESVVLVDDERANFRSDSASVRRYCKVARYDETYRNCGLLNQMGGLGAHSDSDYEALKTFLQQPWEYPYEGREPKSASAEQVKQPDGRWAGLSNAMPQLIRASEDDELMKVPRHRSKVRAASA